MLRHSAMRLVLSTSRCSQAPLAAATTTAASSAVMSAASRGALRVPLPPPTAAFAVRCRCFIGVNPSLRQEVPGQPRGADSQPASYAGVHALKRCCDPPRSHNSVSSSSRVLRM